MASGYEVDFDTVDPRFLCPICLLVMREAVQTACGHRFCKGCLSRVPTGIDSLLHCPVDKTIIFMSQVFPDIATRREILSLRLDCNNSEKSCDWTGELRALESHMEVCPFEMVQCSNRCGAEVLRRDLDLHCAECPARAVFCRHCQAEVIFRSLENHLDTCPKVKICCSVCHTAIIRREDIKTHTDPIDGDCPLICTTCPYSLFGCDYQAERYQVEKHSRQDDVLQRHLRLAVDEIVSHRRQIQKLKDSIDQLQTRTGEFQPVVQNVQRRQDQISRDAHSRNVTGKLHWKVKLSRSHNRGRNTTYCSPAFYTGCPGYKVQLTLNMEGFREGREWYASLGLGLLPGDYDENLVFPFNATCFITLCDQSENLSARQHYEQQIVLRQVPRVTRPGHSGNTRKAIVKFLERRRLMGPTSKYMRNGCLHFEAEVLHSVVPLPGNSSGAITHLTCLGQITAAATLSPVLRRIPWQLTPVLTPAHSQQPPQQHQHQQQQHQLPANVPVTRASTETPVHPHAHPNPGTRVLSVTALALGN